VEEKLGVQYTESRKMEFARSFKECGPASPVFFILSPGVDPLKDVESLGKNTHWLLIHPMHESLTFSLSSKESVPSS